MISMTNEGNARLVTTLPRVHVALCGVDKLTSTLHDALRILSMSSPCSSLCVKVLVEQPDLISEP